MSCKVCKESNLKVHCNGCKFPFWFCDELRKHLDKSTTVDENEESIYNNLDPIMLNDAKIAIDNIGEK